MKKKQQKKPNSIIETVWNESLQGDGIVGVHAAKCWTNGTVSALTFSGSLFLLQLESWEINPSPPMGRAKIQGWAHVALVIFDKKKSEYGLESMFQL